MATSQRTDFPELFPCPRQLTLDGGESNLSLDIRLTTANVLPIQRKAVRSILTASGVRVVANKKTYVVDAKVDEPSVFDLKNVPENCRYDYYELKISGSEVFIRSPYQGGMVWATQTLAIIFRLLQAGHKIPNLTIRDWPALPVRGLFLECHPGLDRMSTYEWYQTFDFLSAQKFNLLGMEMYACEGNCRRDGANRPAEYLLFPIEGQDTLHSERRIRWYSAKGDFWHDERFAPQTAQSEFLSDIINYGKERGIDVVPAINFLGRNSLFSRLIPGISAKNAKGEATEYSFCLSSPATRQFLETMLGDFLAKYFQNGIEYFQILLDAHGDHPHADKPLQAESAWCACAKCKKKSHAALLADYLLWLVKFLLSKNVGKCILDYAQLLEAGFDDKAFAAFVKKLGTPEKLVVLLRGDEKGQPLTSLGVKDLAKLGVQTWMAPLFCQGICDGFLPPVTNVDKLAKKAITDKASGLMGGKVIDFSSADQLAVLSAFAWQNTTAIKPDKLVQAWYAAVFGKAGNAVQEALGTLAKASSEPAYAVCRQLDDFYIGDKDKTWPKPFPEALLNRLSKLKGADKSLAQASSLASKAMVSLAKVTLAAENPAIASVLLDSLRADCTRLQGGSDIFRFLLQLRTTIAKDGVHKPLAKTCQDASKALKAQLTEFEKGKASWIVSDSLQPLSYLLIFLQQLEDDLKNVANHKKGAAVRWVLDEGWQVPSNL